MERQYQSLQKQLRQPAPQTFHHLFVRFGFPELHINMIWQSEIVQMAYRNYLNNYIDLEYFYVIVYEWIESNRSEYGRKQYMLFIFSAIREEAGPIRIKHKRGREVFLYSKFNHV